ncbi:MAG: hypothetical protein IT305_18550 [Chloroflexi bacterium]|nr:hypothetical protein [Chloroflexota bacterium]
MSARPATSLVAGETVAASTAAAHPGLAAGTPAARPPTVAMTAAHVPHRRPRALAIVGAFVGLVIVPVIVLALLVVNPLALYFEGRAPGPTVTTPTSGPTRIKIAAGETSTWYVMPGHSITGLWATPGLELVLNDPPPGVGQRTTVTSTRPPGWGETITIVQRGGRSRTGQETVVPGSFTAPAELPEDGAVVHGRLTGQITAPRLTEGSSQFVIAADAVDIPVELEVVSWPAFQWDRFVHSVEMFFSADRWLTVSIGALIAWTVLAAVISLLSRRGHAS